MKRYAVNVDRRVIHAQELAVPCVALDGMGGSGWAELEKGSKAGGYSQGHAIGVVDGNTFQVLALAEAVYKALQALVREMTVKLRLATLLHAFPKRFQSARAS